MGLDLDMIAAWMDTDWVSSLSGAIAVVLALEVLYLVLRKRVPGFRLRLLYHLWVANLAALLVLRQLGPESLRSWQIAAASAVLAQRSGALCLARCADSAASMELGGRARSCPSWREMSCGWSC